MAAPTYLSERQLAQRWNVGRSTISRLRAAGQLPFMRFGSVVRIAVRDIETFEANHSHDSVVIGFDRPKAARRNG